MQVLIKEGSTFQSITPISEKEEKWRSKLLNERILEEIILQDEKRTIKVKAFCEEFAFPDGNSVDLLIVDDKFRIYLCEVKMAWRGSERYGFGQALEYLKSVKTFEKFEDFWEKLQNNKSLKLINIGREKLKKKLKKSFGEENVVSVLVMNEIPPKFIPVVYEIPGSRFYAVELNFFKKGNYEIVAVKKYGWPAVFGKKIRRPITKEKFIENYTQLGLRDLAEEIVDVFQRVCEENPSFVKIRRTPKYYSLVIGDPKVFSVGFHSTRETDDGIWVEVQPDENMKREFLKLERKFGLKVDIKDKKGTKWIKFPEGKGVSILRGKIKDLVYELIRIYKSHPR
ncbi:hypothetical protein DRP07_04220 [Archaeoglobales archaeon]|nr:MAG: hypothetical protein DRP07_04220 [Archaeoglobales archaeon]